MAAASTSESISASIIPIFISSFNKAMVLFRVVVFPDPGDDIRFSRKVLCAFNSFRSASASLSLSSNTLFLISSIFISFISFSFTCKCMISAYIKVTLCPVKVNGHENLT